MSMPEESTPDKQPASVIPIPQRPPDNAIILGDLKWVKISIQRSNFLIEAAFAERKHVDEFLNRWIPETKPPF